MNGPVGSERTTDSAPILRERGPVARLAVAIWVLMLGLPLAGTLATEHLDAVRLTAMSVLVAVTAGTYVAFCLLRDAVRATLRRSQLAALSATILVAATALVFVAGPEWDYAFVYAFWPVVALDRTKRVALLGVVALAVVVGVLGGITPGNLATVVLVLIGVGASIVGVTRLVEAARALERARADEARLAIAEERLRFARDLHELLGHSLSVVALKAEVASRLLRSQPERAEAELSEIEQVTRRALQEVRDAVTGYRQPTLAGELANARQVLATAGIAWEESLEPTDLPATLEAPLAWALREGVTNVVRHSGALACRLELSTSNGWTTLTVTDDGSGPPAERAGTAPPRACGNGLTGLAERLAALGGRLDAGPASGGGFVLCASLPRPAEPRATTATRRAEKVAP